MATPPRANLSREEPDAGNLHVRVCEGWGRQRPHLLGSRLWRTGARWRRKARRFVRVVRGCRRRSSRPASWSCDQSGEEQAAEQRRQHAHRQEEAGRQAIQRCPSSEMPPPGTIMWTCGWWVSAEPQVCSTAVMPIRAPRCLGSAAIVSMRLGGGPEQEVVDDGLVLEGDVGDLGRQREDDVEVGDRQQFGLALGQPLRAARALALRAMPVAAGNGRRPLPALWADPVMGSWRRLDRALASAAANPAHHYEGRLRSAISLSDGWNAPRRRCGGTIDSMASSFSVGSPRV